MYYLFYINLKVQMETINLFTKVRATGYASHLIQMVKKKISGIEKSAQTSYYYFYFEIFIQSGKAICNCLIFHGFVCKSSLNALFSF